MDKNKKPVSKPKSKTTASKAKPKPKTTVKKKVAVTKAKVAPKKKTPVAKSKVVTAKKKVSPKKKTVLSNNESSFVVSNNYIFGKYIDIIVISLIVIMFGIIFYSNFCN